jgi:hypothetical protein
MAGEQLKSASITNSDATPITANTAGEGGQGDLFNGNDYVSVTTTGLASTSSTYKVVRLQSDAKLKAMRIITTSALDSNATPTLAVDVGAYYSDATNDGTQPSLQGTSIGVASFLSNTLFGGATTLSVDALQAYSVDKRTQPLWKGLGLSTDPLGWIDVVVAVHATAATAVAGKLAIDVQYVAP